MTKTGQWIVEDLGLRLPTRSARALTAARRRTARMIQKVMDLLREAALLVRVQDPLQAARSRIRKATALLARLAEQARLRPDERKRQTAAEKVWDVWLSLIEQEWEWALTAGGMVNEELWRKGDEWWEQKVKEYGVPLEYYRKWKRLRGGR